MAISNFIPTIWSARLLHHLDNALVGRRFFNTEWEGEIRDAGDRVKINQIGRVSIFEYHANQDLHAPEQLSSVQTDMLIDFARAFNFQIDDIDAVQSKPALMDAAMQRSAQDLSETADRWLMQRLLDGVAPSNRINTTVNNADDVYVLLTRLRTMLVRANVPIAGRLVAMPPELVELVLQDDRFVNTGGNLAEATLTSGIVARAAGFGILEVNTIPGNNAIIAGHPISATMATQISKVEAYRMEKRFADGVKGLFLAGAQVTRPTGIAVATIGNIGGGGISAAAAPLAISFDTTDDTKTPDFANMTRAQLEEFANAHNIDISGASNNSARIAILQEYINQKQ